MNFLSMLGAAEKTSSGIFNLSSDSFEGFDWLYPIAKFLESLLVPITIIVAVAGAIWVIFLGINLARAESADKAQEAKKRLINVAVAMVCVIIFIWLLTWFVTQVPTLFSSSPISTETEEAESIIKAFFRM